MRTIDENSLTKVEEHVTNHRNIVNELNCCFSDTYKAQDDFRFIPGHRSAILAIPAQIEKIKAQGKKKVERKRKPRTIEGLKKMLIAQLNSYPSKIGFNLPNGVISDLNIVNVAYEQQSDDCFVVDCGFSCPFCDKVTKVTFKKFWWSTNATKHLKKHVDEFLARV